ncbi:hypothetical protein [Bradyrhizobium erythrophlei]|uniref:Uncharacterized protein n=1 Tax=Bradyrhizobium erythrophlei TaxID=1437360 RepID=A0A1M7UVG9_9BRAD|nr:hypothetical protein [Bradyrhizobium erythrophlei]SHN86917.1 hypothetical protein SAMN05444170_6916 [Bradyrhizobium erythrophlei]
MSQTTIPMKMGTGLGVPTVVQLPDSTTLTPDVTGLINVPASFLISMLAAGWQIQIAANSTHVP